VTSSILAAVIVVLAAGAGMLVVADLPAGETPDSSTGDVTATATTDSPDDSSGTSPDDDSDESTPTTATTDDSDSGYDFTIENIEECGSTCRDVTAVLANTGDETRQNVRATTKVFADGDLLWTGNETVGTLDPEAAHTSTKRVNVGFAGGMKIQDNDGYVTIVTVIRSDDGTVRFSERRKVA
jgi:hypothetical protein